MIFGQPGSKIPMITTLLERTLEYRRERFEPLMLEIVRAGLTYRQKQGNPITPEEVQKLNGLILEIGFKFPDLASGFITSLRADSSERAKEYVNQAMQREKLKATERSARNNELEKLKRQFYNLHGIIQSKQSRPPTQKVLNRLFELHGLSPREPFRVVGEQIDGSFILDHEIYLLEAKWHQTPLPEGDLLIFRGKVEGKSKYTRGVFISVKRHKQRCSRSHNKRKTTQFFCD